MIILYGTRKFKRHKGQTMGYLHCDHCGNDRQWQYIHLWTWFTLFYIPLFPVWRRKMLICPICEYGVKINKDNSHILSQIEMK